MDPKALDHDRLLAFGDALDALQARLDTLDRIAALDHRRDDLAGWAADRRRGEALAAARTAGTRARLTGTSDSLQAYEIALDQVRDGLAHTVTGVGHQAVAASDSKSGKGAPCLEGDPGCGLDGRRAF